MESRQYLQNMTKRRSPIRRAHAGQRWIREDATGDKLHEVELRTQNAGIPAVGVHGGHRNLAPIVVAFHRPTAAAAAAAVVVVPPQGRQHAKLAIQRVGRLVRDADRPLAEDQVPQWLSL